MKRLLALLLAVVSVVAMQAQTQDNAMYIYRNDGGFNAFLREDIDSITLSHFDIDSIQHQEPVCQVFHTPDSIYRIPIAAIDSVAFVQPETKYAQGVILLDEQYIPYIVDVTENTITFSFSTPSELLPKRGNVLAAMAFEGILSDGFAGRVVSVSQTTAGLTFLCDGVDITDIYERLVYVGTVKTEQNGSDILYKVKRITNGSHSFNLGDIKGNLGPLWVSVTPTWTLSYVLFIEPEEDPVVSLILFQDYDGKYGLDCKLDIGTNGHNIHWLPGEIRLNTPVAGLYGSINWGLFYSATASAQLTWSQDFNIKWNYGFSLNGNTHKVINAISPQIGDPSLSISVNGEVNAGICVSFSLGFISNKIASIFANAYLGGYASAQFDAKAQIGQYDTAYKGLKDGKVEVGIYAAGVPGYRLWFEKDKEIPVGLDYHKPLKSWDLLPDFTAPQIKYREDKKTLIAICEPSRDIIMPVSLGLGIEDEAGKTIDIKWCDEKYWREQDWPTNALWQQFDGLYAGNKYTVSPYLKIMDVEMKAYPSSDAELDGEVTTGDVTNITSESAILYGTASSAFDFTQSGVSAGFCLGKQQEIDLYNSTIIRAKADETYNATASGLESNTTYYYRAFVTVGTKAYYGDICSFKTECGNVCADDNHPHTIDLGLPSGTKWSCCNVGAEAPDEHGSFYAWAETTPKQTYSWDNYSDSPYNEDGDWIGCSIMRDISSSEHDVATMALGGKWRIPTKDEMQELFDKCEWIWEENGYKVTGPNGNSIFLPAAGNADGGNVNQAGSYGGYWTSTPNESESKATASNLYFYKASTKSIQWSNRYVGRSIRPVTSRD